MNLRTMVKLPRYWPNFANQVARKKLFLHVLLTDILSLIHFKLLYCDIAVKNFWNGSGCCKLHEAILTKLQLNRIKQHQFSESSRFFISFK